MRILILKDINNQPSDRLLKVLFERESSCIDIICLEDLIGNYKKIGSELHQYIYNEGGLSKGIETLSKLEKIYDIAIGFSAGGYFLWKASQSSNFTKRIVCVSASRLRFESAKEESTVDITLIYGYKDSYLPDKNRVKCLSNRTIYISNELHDSYNVVDSKMNQSIQYFIREEGVSKKNLDIAANEYRLGKYERSAQVYLRELEKCQLLGDLLRAAEICEMLAVVYSQQGKMNFAEEMYLAALSWYKKCDVCEHWKIPALKTKMVRNKRKSAKCISNNISHL